MTLQLAKIASLSLIVVQSDIVFKMAVYTVLKCHNVIFDIKKSVMQRPKPNNSSISDNTRQVCDDLGMEF